MTGNVRFWAGVWEAEMIGFEQMSGRVTGVALSKHFSSSVCSEISKIAEHAERSEPTKFTKV